MKKKKTAKTSKKKRSFIFTLAALALVGCFVVTVVRLQIDIRQREKELDTINESITSQQQENEKIEKSLEEENEDEYMERIAREKLGYVMPDERVYVDAAAGID